MFIVILSFLAISNFDMADMADMVDMAFVGLKMRRNLSKWVSRVDVCTYIYFIVG